MLFLYGSAVNARSPGTGITVSLRRVWAVPPDQIVCTGACLRGYDLDVTVWDDGELIVGGQKTRIPKKNAIRFRKALLPFLPIGRGRYADPSATFPHTCPVKIQWPVHAGGRRPVYCSLYVDDAVFEAVRRALKLIDVDIRNVEMP